MKDLLRDMEPGEVIRALFPNPGEMAHTTQAATRLLADGLREYRTHRRFGFPHAAQRIAALRKLKLAIIRMRGDSGLHQAAWEQLKGQLNIEFELINKILRHHKKRDPKFNELYACLPTRELRPDEQPASVRTIENGMVHSSLRGKYVLERLDPLNRNRSEMDTIKLVLGFRNWAAGEQMPGPLKNADLWTQWMAYFLYLHDFKPSQTDRHTIASVYHGDKQSFFNSLEFDGMVLSGVGSSGRPTSRMVSRALSYYAFEPSADGPTEYRYYDYLQYGRTHFPSQAPYHTVSKQRRGTFGDGQGWTGSVVYPENKHAPARTFNLDAPQLGWAQLYTLVGKTFHVAPQDRFHSYAASGQSVAAAGMIAADNGKIVAIDNASGHYTPNWRQLRQAVQLILNAGAFTRNAVVGTLYAIPGTKGVNAAILPVMDFLRLCAVIHNRRYRAETWRTITQGLPDVATMDRERGGVLTVYQKVWAARELDWEKVGKGLFEYIDETG